MAHGLPLEGERAGERRAIDFSARDAVTCALGDRVGSLGEAVERSPYRFALVLSAGGVLLGRVSSRALRDEPEKTAEAVMSPGPKTYRPNVDLSELLASLTERDLSAAILTDPEGQLLGVVARSTLEGR